MLRVLLTLHSWAIEDSVTLEDGKSERELSERNYCCHRWSDIVICSFNLEKWWQLLYELSSSRRLESTV